MIRPEINLFNTATQQVEPLQVENHRVSLYVCGITPYDTTHLGHAFTYVMFDTLVRFLRSTGHDVTYAQNVTDIDDDILRKSSELGVTYDQLARTETERYLRDMAVLNVDRPTHLVWATQIIEGIVSEVARLLEAEDAYAVDGNVYFDNRRFPGYGSIAHVSRDEMVSLASTHGGFPDDPKKRDPLDFLLWQAKRPGEPSWPSPFGPGRPGWHIECSTIATSFLGTPVTIHGGGRDLVFPHHASEIAQVESLDPAAPFVSHWMHTAMVRYEGEKMSKSLGNLILIGDLVERFSPSAIRLYLLSHHYREEFEFSEEDLMVAAELDERMQLAIERGDAASSTSDWGGAVQEAQGLLSQDFDTPGVVRLLDRLTSDFQSRSPQPGQIQAIRSIANLIGAPQRLAAAAGES